MTQKKKTTLTNCEKKVEGKNCKMKSKLFINTFLATKKFATNVTDFYKVWEINNLNY